ncbi:mechanosensitive ion channel protein MscS [Methanomicrobiaceae archaeon CYW5]|uniref:mechanosensitive ion channel family protein n=1 Tax=Methanovulcanius yangii TaxID=1789227 RepID=UPI0029CA01D7|nr:mechanosensitive ion channel family protein [Methanovulcanius yangii]MBT8507596.1 mechanosensitive ion channel protein MscS [Methanovulcanius yangii]
MSNIWMAAAIIAIGIIAAWGVARLFRWLGNKADLTESEFDDILVLSFGKPIVVGILLFSFFLALGYIDIPENYAWILESKYLHALYIFLGAWVVSIFVQNFVALYGRWMAEKTESDFDDKIVHILEVTSRYIIWFIAILIVLSYLEIDITPLLAAGGIFGIAIALAAQDLISNFFGGALIVVDKPFSVGDRVMIEGNLGDVVSIGPRSSRIMTLDYQLLTIPNSTIANSIVTNYAMPDIKLKIKLPVSVAYGSDVAQVKKILFEICDHAVAHSTYILDDPRPNVYFLEFGPSSLDFMIVLWAKKFNMSWEIKDWINTEIDRRFAEEGIEIPFPQMDVHLRE